MTTDSTEAGTQTGSATGPAIIDLESWQRLQEAGDPEAFATAWLDIQCRLFNGKAHKGVVVLGAPDQGPFAPAAIWPTGSLGSPGLTAAIQASLAKRQTVIESGRQFQTSKRQQGDSIATPLLIDGKICGAVAIEIDAVTEPDLRQVLGQLEWGKVWLEALVRRSKFTSADRLVTVLELVATALQHDRFQAAATAVATELASALACERVSIGFLRGRHSQVRALSHSASFGKKANIIRAIGAAMDEAIDQQATVVYPVANDEGPLQVTRAHAELVKHYEAGSICTVPFNEGEQILGAITLERPDNKPFDASIVKLCEHAAALLGPLLDVKRKDDRWLIMKAADSVRSHIRKLTGPRHVARKLVATVALLLAVFFAVAEGDYRITGDARLEGSVQRAISVPIAGYVGEANVRAGDIVSAGDVMFSLDNRDLRLELLKWIGQKTQYKREHSEALADHDRAKVRILAAQIEQAEAQIALVEEQLERTQVTAPFDGFVVSGDLSQSLGAPVERGDVLFEVAPLDDYRVILEVDERDIGDLSIAQTGHVALTGMPSEPLSIVVEKITPLSTAEEGRNFFRVDARLAEAALPKLRPGMEGVAKINVERRKLIWIWSHKITHWMRMFFWSWWP